MRDPQELRSLARSCRAFARGSIELNVIEQLRLWAIELAEEADNIERSLENAEAAGELVRFKRVLVRVI